MRRLLAGLAVTIITTAACAGTGQTTLPGLQGDGPVTAFYPTAAPDQPTQRGPFTVPLAPDAEPARGNGRLVIISHGSGGNPWVHTDLARTLVAEGFIVAFPQHRGDHTGDFSTPGPESWKLRPAEVSRAIDAVAADPRFAPLLKLDKVGAFGGSAGGHTMLSLAGGRWSPGQFRRHCEARISDDFSSCVGFITRLSGGWLDGLKKAIALGVIRQRFDDDTWQAHADARIAAVVSAVPFAADFDMASLAAPRIPLALVTAARDVNQIPAFHSSAVLAACRTCEHLADLPDASHGVMLSPMPPLPAGSIAEALLADPPGFDRATVVPAVQGRVVAFMRRHLLP
ncbi:alpha/beta hydrolase family protein [Ramlibacter sp.]|uniref:alpha/beta hydrolase family protein n=1 Tax=Ramlibacter sp. TaxID=1917967 RepID=UPI0035B0E833